MAGSQSGGKGGGGHASNAALDDNEDVKVRRGKHFRAWMAARRKGGSNSKAAPLDMSYPNSPKPPAR
jgi:hypothetical protein